jgi:hypothetical protein
MATRAARLPGWTGIHLHGTGGGKVALLTRTWLVALAFAVCSGLAHAQANAWLDLPAGLNYSLVLDADGKLTARIPATVAANVTIPEGGLKTRVFDVVFKEGRSQGLASRFSIEVAKPTSSAALALVVSASQPQTLAPGSYTVVAQVDGEFDTKNSRPQNIVLTLQRLAPQLAASASVVIGQVRSLRGADEVTPASLRLSEQSGRAGANGLAFLEVRDQIAAAALPDTGTLTLPATPVSVPAGGITHVDVGLNGEFPLGKSAGKIEIRSPDLSQPLLVSYEVRVRRELWLIAVFAGLGALLGWIVRVWMAGRQALIAAHVAASDAIALVRKELAASDDATYQKVLNDWRAALARVLESKEAARIADEAKKAVDDVTAKRTGLQERLTELAKRAEPIRNVLATPWDLPDAAAAALAEARHELETLQERRARHDADGIETTLGRLNDGSLARLFNAAGEQGVHLAKLLRALADEGPPVVDGVKAQIKQLADDAAAQCPPTFAAVKTTTVDELRAMLQKVDGSFVRTSRLASALESLTNQFFTWAQAELPLEASEGAAKLAPLRAAAAELAAGVAAQVRAPDTAPLQLKAGMERMKGTWKSVLGTLGATKPEVGKAVNEGRWSDVVAIVRDELAPKETQLGGAMETPQALPTRQATIDMGSTRSLSAPPGSPEEPMPALLGTAQERRALFSEGRLIALAQSLIFAALFTVGVYLLYADTWVGTGKELLALIVLGFGVDLTGDSVVAVFKKLKLPEA